ncbi:MAG: glycosyltransferase [Bacteroidaceae bacterium]|nr:glycosyltransferase [Bacteroidaceae bacterium]
MKNQPLVSVITVTFNAAATVERTLKSVEEQTYDRVEHIVVDGCSTDGTLSLVQRYIEHNRRPECRNVRVLREPDQGLYDAMNKAVGMAEGVYVVFLNAGDKFHEPTTLEQVMEQVDWEPHQVNYAVVYGETDLVDDEGNFLRHRRLQAPERLRADSFRDGMLVCHQSFYVRTDLAKSIRYDLRYRYSADFDWCVRVMQRAERRGLKFLNTQMVLTDYLHEGLTTRNHRRSLLERLHIMARHFGWSSALLHHLWFVVRAVTKR